MTRQSRGKFQVLIEGREAASFRELSEATNYAHWVAIKYSAFTDVVRYATSETFAQFQPGTGIPTPEFEHLRRFNAADAA